MGISIQERKLHIIGRLASSNDELLIQLIEDLLFDETEHIEDEILEEAEASLLRERVAAYHADADDEISWEDVKASLNANHALRG